MNEPPWKGLKIWQTRKDRGEIVERKWKKISKKEKNNDEIRVPWCTFVWQISIFVLKHARQANMFLIVSSIFEKIPFLNNNSEENKMWTHVAGWFSFLLKLLFLLTTTISIKKSPQPPWYKRAKNCLTIVMSDEDGQKYLWWIFHVDRIIKFVLPPDLKKKKKNSNFARSHNI